LEDTTFQTGNESLTFSFSQSCDDLHWWARHT